MTIQRAEGPLTQRVVPGPALYFRETIPASCRAVVALVHGYADHGGRYERVMASWAEQGIGTVAVDLRGHGRASGTRGYCSRFDEFLDDVTELARLASDRVKGAPAFLFGHSFGGLVAITSVLEARRSWRGLVLSAPYLDLAMEVPKAKLAAGKVAARLLPKLGLPSGLKGADLTRDPARARAYDEDPLVFKEARARWFTETQRAQANAQARAKEIDLPVYVVYGTEDRVTSMAAARRFYDALGSSDKTWVEREGLYHETWNEPEGAEVVQGMAEWMLQRI